MVPAWYKPATFQLRLELLPGNYSTYRDHAPRNSKRLWTRAEVDGGANNGPPQTPTLGDVQGQRSMDTHRGSNNNFIKYAHALGKRSWNFSHAPAQRRPLDNGETSSLAPLAPSGSSLLEVWE